eukprot:TRINITY_DN6656_c0_g1_i3.p1 TRINITY_DN6656_c0_g1~~TRINITY_DN6656_c0_g1_i3.p1  ORF type:complete len:191 (-),score=39.56 TRINITY_DN6656_c0_g1_i3:61-633(-)
MGDTPKPQWNIIDDYDKKQQPPLHSGEELLPKNTTATHALSNEFSQLFSEEKKNPSLVIEFNEEETQLMVDNFEGEQLEVTSFEQLREVLRNNELDEGAMNQVFELLNDQVDESWVSASILFDEDKGKVEELANSLLVSQQRNFDLNTSYVANQGVTLIPPTISSWIDMNPSAPPLESDEFELVPALNGA